jgi:predicted AlkP superfamily phosphohydrolase/phosphomutase
VDGVVYVGSTTGELHAVGLEDGKARWRYKAAEEGIGESSPAVVDGIVYFGDLEWRSVGTMNMEGGQVFTYENDTGPDGANHDKKGVFALRNLPGQPTGRTEGLNLIDVGPTLMKLYGLPEPEGVQGKSIL